jgi:hypothetical protein
MTQYGLAYENDGRFKDLRALKPSFTCLENPFPVNIIENGHPIPWPLILNMSAPEMELQEHEENEGLQQLKSSCSSTIQFWKHVP